MLEDESGKEIECGTGVFYLKQGIISDDLFDRKNLQCKICHKVCDENQIFSFHVFF